MGNRPSKGQVISQKPPEIQEPEYRGPSAQYQFVNIEARLCDAFDYQARIQMVTSNVDTHYGLLGQQYDQGYRLLTFYHIPGVADRAGNFTTDMTMPFQGIFCRYPQEPSNEKFQLRIEKSIIQPHTFWNGWVPRQSEIVTDTSHLFQTIANNTQNGGRLICMELTGQTQTEATLIIREDTKPILGCDLFFEIPLEGSTETYIYNVVCGTISVTTTGKKYPESTVNFDWNGMLAQYLGQGFKLVEIFMDQTEITQAGFTSQQSQLNSQWIFEKPSSRISDNTPHYQGTIVEHEVEIITYRSGSNAIINWEPVIQDMGNRGWELACFLETPEMRYSGMRRKYQKILIFFQRKILN